MEKTKSVANLECLKSAAFGRFKKVVTGLLFCGLWLLAQASQAEVVSWLADPVDNNWNNPANWSAGRVPNSLDEVRFAVSVIREISITEPAWVYDLVFEPDAQAFTITAQPVASLTFTTSTLYNYSTVEQNFVATSDGKDRAAFDFRYSGENTIDGPVTFTQEARNGGSGLPPLASFDADGGDATLHNLGASVAGGEGGVTSFGYNRTSAQNSTIINDGATVAGATGGHTEFTLNSPDAGNATIIAHGGTNGGGGGLITFDASSKAENSILIANGGLSGGGGGTIMFSDATDGGAARVEVFGNANLDLRQHNSQPPMTIGSLEGDGVVFLSQHSLTIGGNGLSTTFSGVVQGNGALVKTGAGTLALSGANLYRNGTTVTEGVLTVSNTDGSATGTGGVVVNAGTLGGSGIIESAVTVGTGSGAGAYLTPGIGTSKQTTLTIQSALTINSDATYAYTFKGNRNRVRTDLVIANGVTINGGTFAISSSSQNRMRRGTVLTIISNTSADPISGTFSNLPDGAIVNVNGNNLQASYSDGDGNDLTLMVML